MDARIPAMCALHDRLLAAVRDSFRQRAYLEVGTPVLLRAPAPEAHIDAFPVGDHWLRASPELQMKRLVAGGVHRCFQVGPCFRAGEHGRRHRAEFTMIEWYRAPADYRELLAETAELLAAWVTAVHREPRCSYQGHRLEFSPKPRVRTVREAFAQWADCTPETALAIGQFEELLVTRIEPHLGTDGPEFLVDYPIACAALARPCPADPTLAERWELYLGGLEIANAYGELTDPVEQRRRFAATNAERRQQGLPPYPLDEAFLAELAQMPPTAGCALGLDRLLMVLTDTADLADLRPFA